MSFPATEAAPLNPALIIPVPKPELSIFSPALAASSPADKVLSARPSV